MEYTKIKKLSKITFVIFNFLVLLTLFMPAISIDKYVEYNFYDGYYNPSYVGYEQPIATKISPFMMIENLFVERIEYNESKTEFFKYNKELLAKVASGEMTESEYNKTISKSKVYNKYMSRALYFGNEEDLSRLKSKMFLYCAVILAIYIVVFLLFILNLINLLSPQKLLCIANVFVGFVTAILYLIFNIYTFSLAVNSRNNITGFDGNIMEETSICLSPKFIPIVVMIAFIAYSLFALYLLKKDNRLAIQDREIPKIISQNISNTNRYRKINSKKRKYKNGSKKKRHR